ncbi:DUF6233 domain-containing protein [Streptomyces sp. NPDC048434]|uniref:DUF6233 domain-containing protein n=1 Tax=Streptomyces sp. NPDC048434 TaxID=3365549 RepID=UPI0037182A86
MVVLPVPAQRQVESQRGRPSWGSASRMVRTTRSKSVPAERARSMRTQDLVGQVYGGHWAGRPSVLVRAASSLRDGVVLPMPPTPWKTSTLSRAPVAEVALPRRAAPARGGDPASPRPLRHLVVRPRTGNTRPGRRPPPRVPTGDSHLGLQCPAPRSPAGRGRGLPQPRPPPSQERKRWPLGDAPLWRRAEFLIHRPDCAQVRSNRLLTDQEALAMLTHPETAACCEACGPDTVLRQLH